MREDLKGMGGFGTLGLEVVLSIALGTYVGDWADGKLSTAPYLTALGFAFGVATAGRFIWRAWKKAQAIAAQEEREQGNPAPQFEAPSRPAPGDREKKKESDREP
jgi:ATP synthase protein I